MAKDLYYIAKNWDIVDDEAKEYFKKCLVQDTQDYEINNYEIDIMCDDYVIYKRTTDNTIMEIGYKYDVNNNVFEKYNISKIICDLCEEDIPDGTFCYNNIEKELNICQSCEATEEGQEFIKENELTI